MPKLSQPLLIPALFALCAGSGSDVAESQTAVRAPPAPGMSAQVPFNHHLLVDQFGYRPNDPKVAVVREARVGYDVIDKFTPGSTYRVRNAEDGRIAFSGSLVPWMQGSTQASSGDHGWWFDFSSVNTPGAYFIDDAERNLRSATFRIDDHVYANILAAATRMYFYQRSGFAKRKPFVPDCWTDEPAYLGPDQDSQAHDITDRNNRGKVRDLSGGWFDAGDTNKYVTFAAPAVHQLLSAYQENPGAFTDSFNIPESGNGVPDVLDEVKWETDWLKKMQSANGSSALKVGSTGYPQAAPPSSDAAPRFYVPSCTSATIASAGMFAHASLVFGKLEPLARDAGELKTRAVNAWNNYRKTPKQLHCDNGEVKAGNADWTEADQNASAVLAAIYLFAVTDAPAYDNYVKAHYKETRPYNQNEFGWSRYNPDQGEALLFYTTLPHADAALKKTILADKLRDVKAGNQVYGFNADDDLYRAFLPDAQYHWGSNMPRANYGNTNMDVVTYQIDPANTPAYETRGLEILHYFHGVNPFAMVYLSNMYSYGATRSANEIYHSWFWHGTRWSDALKSQCGPAPGFVPGGPNAKAGEQVPHTLVPPTGQPPQKSYRDWNVGYPESAWTVTEPGIYYQSGYVKLLSKFVR